MDGAPKSQAESVLRGAWRAVLLILVLVVVALAWLVVVDPPYTANSDFGYYLGLAGGLMMLSLLLYPLRKRLRALERLGKMETWFRYHMVLGISGPVLILFHSTFRIGSMNARVALYSMLMVVASGIIGRYLYRHIHRGLYGKKINLSDAEAELKSGAENALNVFALCPEVQARIESFRTETFASLAGVLPRVIRFMTLRWRTRRLQRELEQEIKNALRQLRRQEGRTRNEMILRYQLAKEQISAYLNAIVQAAQLQVWERLFSLWHVAHIPFLYLLLICGIVHVIAVHMY